MQDDNHQHQQLKFTVSTTLPLSVMMKVGPASTRRGLGGAVSPSDPSFGPGVSPTEHGESPAAAAGVFSHH
ncbi:hypothetical protein B0T21DRAFT_359520 [Apiosordaria backusii]|uniref:Uncharacterized protein n=1 Tax=Apiosordaria backusii TaxID=314023 RepID=A0AA40K4A5_9PEZI|nr:hypothetical protein B0T21DRAFT_359520 [Apiosordaria backusii]